MWLSLMLRHAPALEELSLRLCGQITGLLVEEGESNLSNISSAPEASSSGNPQPQEASSSRDGLLCIPPNLISSLKNMCFEDCYELTFQGNKKGFSEFTLLEKLTITCCPKMISSCVHNDKNDDHAANGRLLLPQSLVQLDISDSSSETLQLCFPGNLTCLKKLHLGWSPRLESLQLRHCTALEELLISGCESLTEVEGPPSLGGIRSLSVRNWPGLIPWFERPFSEGYDMRPRLVELAVDDWSILTTLSCMHLTFLERLEFNWCCEKVTSHEQERALQLLTSLQELVFNYCHHLEELPAVLHSLPSLNRLKIDYCRRISRLPEKGLPPSLEELEISDCSEELTEQCRKLATTKRKVKIDYKYMN
jgi:Leucine-rich repeat (LRR) protein